ncbi:unnamed protein product [Arctia plantaginis]|uniref:NADH dehydrogenase [ubiquinone] 1 alpha subcomplex subunit 2 n=1 Tax=Arctia plantaginis TaxID=874455 RepID=A0A8S1AHR4_ARCPL|nr:unnamed protein product [Arctia plantaginis]
MYSVHKAINQFGTLANLGNTVLLSIIKFDIIFIARKNIAVRFSQSSQIREMSLKFSAALKELRIHLCQTGKQSQGVRDFIKNNYVALKKENPNIPILIRECSGVQPRLWARYEKGVEKSAPLTDHTSNNVMAAVKQLAN